MKKQSIATIITIILVCAMVLALTVYAWIEVITGVNISGINVKPTEGKGLKIKKVGDTSFSISATASTASAKNLNSVSTADLINWYVPYDDSKIGSDGSYADSFVKIDSAEAAEYYYSERFVIQSTQVYMGGLKVTAIEVTNAAGQPVSAEISKAIRIGFKFNTNSEIKMFAPVEGADTQLQVVNGENSTTEVSYLAAPAKVSGFPITANNEFEVEVFVWYEGQDSHFTAANLVNAEELRITVHFDGAE